MSVEKVCIVGAGSSGITACQVLAARGDPVRLLREGLEDRRQLALRKRQRPLLGLPLAAHQQRPQDHVVPGLPDARRPAGLPGPLPDREVLRRLRRALRARRADHVQHRGEGRRARRRRVGGDGRGARRRASRRTATGRSWSPTATTGTRAGPNRRSPVPRSSPASRSTSTTTASPTSSSASASSSSGSATRRSTSRSSPRGSPRRRSWRCAAAPTSCPSSSAASRSTKSRRPGRPPAALGAARRDGADAEHGGRRRHRLRAAEARPQAARGAPHRLLGAAARGSATATSPSSPTSTASPAAAPSASSTAARRRSTSSSTAPGYRITFPFLSPEVFEAKDNQMPLYQQGGLGRAPRPLLHRLRPAAGADHAGRRGPVRMGRRPAAGPGAAALGRPRCGPRSQTTSSG